MEKNLMTAYCKMGMTINFPDVDKVCRLFWHHHLCYIQLKRHLSKVKLSGVPVLRHHMGCVPGGCCLPGLPLCLGWCMSCVAVDATWWGLCQCHRRWGTSAWACLETASGVVHHWWLWDAMCQVLVRPRSVQTWRASCWRCPPVWKWATRMERHKTGLLAGDSIWEQKCLP